MHLFTGPYFKLLPFVLFALLLAACQGQPSERTQIQPQQNMYWQEKFKAFEPNDFFDDRRAMRKPVEGTIARGHLRNDRERFEGVDSDGSFITHIPVPVTRELLDRGQAKYNISCTPCHGVSGYGNGLVIDRGYVTPPSFYEDRLLDMPDGEIYSAIYNGAGSMPSYRRMVNNADDRWAIVAYIRALQISQAATQEDLDRLGISAGMLNGDSDTSDMATE